MRDFKIMNVVVKFREVYVHGIICSCAESAESIMFKMVSMRNVQV